MGGGGGGKGGGGKGGIQMGLDPMGHFGGPSILGGGGKGGSNAPEAPEYQAPPDVVDWGSLIESLAPTEPDPVEEVPWNEIQGTSWDVISSELGSLEEGQVYGWTPGADDDTPGSWSIMSLEDFTAMEDPYGYNATGQSYNEGIDTRETLYGQYLDAGDRATKYVNDLILDESSNAALLGIEYNISEEQKTERINEAFSTFWSAEQDSELRSSMASWGNPEGFEDWLYVRTGDGMEEEEEEDTGSEVPTSRAAGNRTPSNTTSILTEDDEDFDSSKTLLGG